MGGPGYHVCRYKGHYFVYYQRSDAHPEALGVELLREIPIDIEPFQRWLAETKKIYGERVAMLSPESILTVDGGSKHHVTLLQPHTSARIEWVWEINLDDLTFCLNGSPFFCLDYRPSTEIFLESIGRDHYNHIIPSDKLPREYRARVSRLPPYYREADIQVYKSNSIKEPQRAVREVLFQRGHFSNHQTVCIRMMEVAVGLCLCSPCRPYLSSTLMPDESAFTDELKDMARMLIRLAVCPVEYCRLTPTRAESDENKVSRDADFWWVRRHICVHFATHLDDERNLQAAVSRIVEELSHGGDTEVVYGVAFSFLHIVIVCHDKRCKAFMHTRALPFLPEPLATSPSTRGITALVCLGDSGSVDDKIFYARRLVKVHGFHDVSFPVGEDNPRISQQGSGKRMANEIWTTIASFIHDGRDLASFALASHQTLSAALPWLKYPQIRVPTNKSTSDVIILSGVGPTDYLRRFKDEHLHLYGGTFRTIWKEAPSVVSITIKRAASIFQATSAERFRFPGIDPDDCQFAVFLGPLEKGKDGRTSIPRILD
ncbi:unnamed protein product [Somion occarium]|uniref:Uncharacterized protein n=1 Tax=Somion occarium TaxID=3059160 RepID=A0ABP1CXL1_9APHY